MGAGEGCELDSSTNVLRRMIKKEGLRDVWSGERLVKGWTWVRGKLQGFIFLFVSEGLIVQRKELLDIKFSDHQVLRVEIGEEDGKGRGRRHWKLNIQLSQEKEVCRAFVGKYKDWRTLK